MRLHLIEWPGKLPSPVADQEPEPGRAVAQVHQEVGCLAHRPRTVWDMDVAGADLDDEERYRRRKVTAQSTWRSRGRA